MDRSRQWSARSGHLGIELSRSIVADPRISSLGVEILGAFVLIHAHANLGNPIPSDERQAARRLGLTITSFRRVRAALLASQPPLINEDKGFLAAAPFVRTVSPALSEARARAARTRWETRTAAPGPGAPARAAGTGAARPKTDDETVAAAAPLAPAPAVTVAEVKTPKAKKRPVTEPFIPPQSQAVAQMALAGFEPPRMAPGKAEQVPPCPTEALRDEFNKVCHPPLARIQAVKQWPDQRLRTLLVRWREYPNLQWWSAFFERVAASDYLCGRGNVSSPWEASFDWIIKSANFVKVLEGNYDNRRHGRARQQLFKEGSSVRDANYYGKSEIPDAPWLEGDDTTTTTTSRGGQGAVKTNPKGREVPAK